MDHIVTRYTNRNGTYRYALDGETFLKGSRRRYEAASLYMDRETGTVWAAPHARMDLAVKGHPHGNWTVEQGTATRPGRGWVAIVDGDETPEAPAYDGPSHDPARCSVAGCTLPATGLGA